MTVDSTTVISMVNGDDRHQIFWLKYRDDNNELQLLDIAPGSWATFTVRKTKSDVAATLERKNLAAGGSDSEMYYTSPGKLELWLEPDDTKLLEEGTYIYDVETIINSLKKTVVISTFRIEEGITKPAP